MFFMANEAVIIELGVEGGRPIRRTVANGTSISKGTLCVLSDPNTAAAAGSNYAATLAPAFAGILGKLCTDKPSGSNLLRTAVALDLISGAVVGRAEETGAASEVIRVRLGTF